MEKNKFIIDNQFFNRQDYSDKEWGKLISNSTSAGFIQYMTYEEILEQFGDTLNKLQKATLKMNYDPSEVVILEAEVNDETIAQLDSVEDYEPELQLAIDAYERALILDGKEILKKGSYFIVCEDAIYIAVFEDEYNEKTE